MADTFVRTEDKDGIRSIIHDRPPMNFLSIASMKELLEALKEAEADPEVKVILIKGGGEKLFSAGVDISDHTEDKFVEMGDVFHDLLHAVMYGTKPKIAVVKGAAIGGGCELISFCDMVLASDKAMFSQPEINVGVFPAPAASILPRAIGLKKTYELLLTGGMISAADAEKIGLINHVYPHDELEDKAVKLAGNLCKKSSIVLQLTRKAILLAKDTDLETALERSANVYSNELMKTEDAQIGLKAFMAQQTPIWKNR